MRIVIDVHEENLKCDLLSYNVTVYFDEFIIFEMLERRKGYLV